MQSTKDFEIGIIGGGPAGSTAAAFLADYGFSICLFEKKTFPRETLCGEFLSIEVSSFLKQMNLYNEFILLNPNKIRSFRFFNDSGKNVYSKLNFDAFSLSRSLFDNLLLCNAKRKGIAVFQPAEVKEINFMENYYNLIIKEEEQKEISISVNYIIAAYGKQNPLDNYLNRSCVNYKSKLNGIKFHLGKNELKNFSTEEIQIYAADNIYCGVNAVENNKVTFCFLEDRNNEQLPPRKQLIGLKKKNRAFNELFTEDNEHIFDELPVYGTGNIYFGKKSIIENGIFMIGDAAGVIAPLAGDGIGIAMESGKLIADLFYKKRAENLSDRELKSLYIKKWNKLFSKRMRTARFIQDFILKDSKRNVGFSIAKFLPKFLPYLIKATRNI